MKAMIIQRLSRLEESKSKALAERRDLSGYSRKTAFIAIVAWHVGQHALVGGGDRPLVLALLLLFGVPRQHIGLYPHAGVAVVRETLRKAENLLAAGPQMLGQGVGNRHDSSVRAVDNPPGRG